MENYNPVPLLKSGHGHLREVVIYERFQLACVAGAWK